MKKKTITLKESQLRDMITESIKSNLKKYKRVRKINEDTDRNFSIDTYGYDPQKNCFSCTTDWDMDSDRYTESEAIEAAEYYTQYNSDLDEIVRVYNVETNDIIGLYTTK